MVDAHCETGVQAIYIIRKVDETSGNSDIVKSARYLPAQLDADPEVVR